MAHDLATIGGKTAMFYHGQPPWHGLGTRLEGPATAAQAIKAASLDWEVVKQPIHVSVGSTTTLIADRFATVRVDLLESRPLPILGIVGKDYKPLQNRDAFAWFDSIVGQNAAIYHTAGALGEGERVWMLAKLPGEIRVAKDDISEKFLLLSNSHDGTSSVQVKFTPIRVVCQNTLTMALNTGRALRITHTASMSERLKLAARNLEIITGGFKKIEENFKSMQRVAMRNGRLDDYFNQVFPDPRDREDEAARKRVLDARKCVGALFDTCKSNDLAGVRGTLWAAYNGVAEYVDYGIGSRTPDNRLGSVWFGTGYLTKVRAYRVGLECLETWKN